MGYIYKYIHNIKILHPQESIDDILKNLQNERHPLPPIEVLGIGSDLDIFVDFKESTPPAFQTSESSMKIHSSPKHSHGSVIRNMQTLINSAEEASGMRDHTDSLKKSIVPVADVKEYSEQLARATAQGGSTIDFMAFDLESGKFRMPETWIKHPQLIEDFLCGIFDYLPPTEGEASDKQTIRGLRPLLEIPFLRLTHEGEVQLAKELAILRSKVENGELLSLDAQEQREKLIRNAHFGAANNRLLRSNDQVSKEVQTYKGGLIPEFTEMVDPEQRIHESSVSKLQKSKLVFKSLPNGGEKYLVDPQTFIKQYTDGGKIYHGTPAFVNALSIIRNGLTASKFNGKWGLTEKLDLPPDTGAYISPSRDLSSGYSGTTGALLSLPVKKSNALRILDLRPPRVSIGFLKQIEAQAKEEGMDFNLYLAREHGIDLVIPPTVDNPREGKPAEMLLLNSAILVLPKTNVDLAKMQRDLFLDKTNIQNLGFYSNLIKILRQTGEKFDNLDLPEPHQIAEEALKDKSKKLSKLSTNEKVELARILNEINDSAPIKAQIVSSLLQDNETHVLTALSEVIPAMKDSLEKEKILEKIHQTASKLASQSDWSGKAVISGLLKSLADLSHSSELNKKQLDKITKEVEGLPPETQQAIFSGIFYGNPKTDYWYEYAFRPEAPAKAQNEGALLLNLYQGRNKKQLMQKAITTTKEWMPVSTLLSSTQHEERLEFISLALANPSEEIRTKAKKVYFENSSYFGECDKEKILMHAYYLTHEKRVKEWILAQLPQTRALELMNEVEQAVKHLGSSNSSCFKETR